MTTTPGRPTLATWMQPPGNRWAFRHVREIIPTARVRRGHTSRELPPSPRPELHELLRGGEPLGGYLAASHTDALVVLHRGNLALEWYGDGVEPDDRHILMSVTKSITGLLAGALARSGRLDLAEPVARYVPAAVGSCFEHATVRELLDMRISTAFVEDYSPGPDVRAYRASTGWYPGAADGPGLHRYLAGIGPAGPHGGPFHYVSPCTDMLGWVCERAAGQPYAEALSELVWAPLGAESDAEVTVDRLGAARAAGGLCATARDVARLGLVVMRDGDGVLPEAFVEDLWEAGDAAAWAAGDYAHLLPGGAYRSLWYRARSGELLAIGIHGQLILVDRAREVVVVKQSSWPIAADDPADVAAIEWCQTIAERLASAG